MRGDGIFFWYQSTRLARASASCRYRMGHLAELMRGATTVVDPRPDRRAFAGARVLVVVRPLLDAHGEALLAALGAGGCKLVADFDDRLFSGPPDELPLVQSGALGRAEAEARIARYRAGLARFDAFTVATEPLRQELEAAREGALVQVVPNGLSPSWVAQGRALYPAWQPGDPKVMRYLPGSPSHDADVALVAPLLAALLSDHPDWRLEIVGPLATGELGLPASHVEAGRIRHLERVAYAELPRLLASSWLTLAPLAPSGFTRCKSALKFLESAAFGAPCVASPIADMAQHAAGGVLLPRRLEDWPRALELLAEDEARMRVGARARAHVERHAMAHASVAALGELLARLGVEVVGTRDRPDGAAPDRTGADGAEPRDRPDGAAPDRTGADGAEPRDRPDGAAPDRTGADGAPASPGPRRQEASSVRAADAVEERPRPAGAGGESTAPPATLVVTLRGRHLALERAARALARAWVATGGREARIVRRASHARAQGAGARRSEPVDTARERRGPAHVELGLGSLVRPALVVSFRAPFAATLGARAAELALTSAGWDSLDAPEPWRLLSAPLARLPRWGALDASRPWFLGDLSALARLDAWRPSAQLHLVGEWPAWKSWRRAAHAHASAEERSADVVWWPPSPRVSAAVLGRAASVIARPGPLAFDAVRAGVPVRDADSGLLIDATEMARRAPALAGFVPASLAGEPTLWQAVAESARAIAAGSTAAAPLMTPAWIERGRALARERARHPRSPIELAVRRLDKLRRDPRRFFADSQWRIVRLAGVWWPRR